MNKLEPYYQLNDSVKLYLGDCIEVMRQIPEKSVDVTITDPPYNVDLQYGIKDDNKAFYKEWCQKWFTEIERICKGHILITVGQANLSQWATLNPPNWWMAWWKPAAMGRCTVGFNNWEPIAVYKRGKMNHKGCDVIRATINIKDKDQSEHPCPKPLEWAVKQIEMFATPDCVVFDPFSGSGTTALACLKTNRKFVGIEHDKNYCDLIKKRADKTIGSIFP